jgi:hypothetical protein
MILIKKEIYSHKTINTFLFNLHLEIVRYTYYLIGASSFLKFYCTYLFSLHFALPIYENTFFHFSVKKVP